MRILPFRKVITISVAVVVIVGIAAVLFVTLRPEEVVEEPFFPRRSHENYREALDRLEIADSEMGSRWIAAADEVTEAAVTVSLPVEEVVYFDPRDPIAIGYRFAVTRGRRVDISIVSEHSRYFADLFRLVPSPSGASSGDEGDSDGDRWELGEHVASRSANGNDIVFESRENNFYFLRIQPELLRGGRFTISVVEDAPLAFPVEGKGPGDIWSYFGDGRDGGARIHHGVDIFAPRGTPLVAVSDGEIIRVGQRDRGGNVVVLRDTRRNILVYYAHLDRHLIENGVTVRSGDVLGTVGNTGNAVTTPPHLHIGIYQGSWRRPVDPWPYLVGPAAAEPPAISTEVETTGMWIVPDGEVTMSDTLPGSSSAGDGAETTRRNRNPFLRGAGDTFVGAEAESAVTGQRDASELALRPKEQALDGDTPIRVIGILGESARLRSVTGRVGVIPVARINRDIAPSRGEEDAIFLDGEREVRDVLSGDAITPFVEGASATHIADVSGRAVVVLPSGDLAVLGEEL